MHTQRPPHEVAKLKKVLNIKDATIKSSSHANGRTCLGFTSTYADNTHMNSPPPEAILTSKTFRQTFSSERRVHLPKDYVLDQVDARDDETLLMIH